MLLHIHKQVGRDHEMKRKLALTLLNYLSKYIVGMSTENYLTLTFFKFCKLNMATGSITNIDLILVIHPVVKPNSQISI